MRTLTISSDQCINVLLRAGFVQLGESSQNVWLARRERVVDVPRERTLSDAVLDDILESGGMTLRDFLNRLTHAGTSTVSRP